MRNLLEAQADDRPIRSANRRTIQVPAATSTLVVEWIGDGFVYDPIIVYSADRPASEVKSGSTGCRFEDLAFELESPGPGFPQSGKFYRAVEFRDIVKFAGLDGCGAGNGARRKPEWTRGCGDLTAPLLGTSRGRHLPICYETRPNDPEPQPSTQRRTIMKVSSNLCAGISAAAEPAG